MDRKEAILRIKDHMEHHGIGKYPHLKLKEALDMAIAALSQPNEPMTLEQLREMDEPTPVWWEKASYWCLCERGFIIVPNGNIYEFEETDGTFYRRPPEGDVDGK